MYQGCILGNIISREWEMVHLWLLRDFARRRVLDCFINDIAIWLLVFLCHCERWIPDLGRIQLSWIEWKYHWLQENSGRWHRYALYNRLPIKVNEEWEERKLVEDNCLAWEFEKHLVGRVYESTQPFSAWHVLPSRLYSNHPIHLINRNHPRLRERPLSEFVL